MVDAPTQTTTRTGTHYPAHTQDPKWTDNYIMVAVQDLEKLVVPKFTNASARDTAIPSPTNGDFAFLLDTKVLQVYETSWKQIWPSTAPAITGGTAPPSGGANGDVYLQYSA